MNVSRLFRMIMMTGICLLFASCSGGGGGGDPECDCDDSPTVEKSGLVLSLTDQDENSPANVSILFKVEQDDTDGTPVTDLDVGNVRILEDGELISELESQEAILPKPGKFKSHILLLLDLSGSMLESESLPRLREAARSFVDAMMPSPDSENFGEIEMGIWWFDGAKDIHPLVSFVTDIDELISGIDTIDKDISNDSSTNLHGAVIQGIDKLKDLAVKERNIVSVGSLVIFTDGKDQADRKTKQEALDAVEDAGSNISIYSIGLGGEIDEDTLKAFGKDDFVSVQDIQELVPKFEEIGDNIRKDVKSYYLLEYCSPKRKGSHDLKITVIYETSDNDVLSGSLTTCFCAKGFKGGCEVSSDI